MKTGKQLVCLCLVAFLCLSFPVNSKSMADTMGDITADNAMYQYLVGELSLQKEGEIPLSEMTLILSKLFLVSQDSMFGEESLLVPHEWLYRLLKVYCGADTTLIHRHYQKETEYVTYEQFFDAVDYYYLTIAKKHGMTVQPAMLYPFLGNTQLLFDDGSQLQLAGVHFPESRVTVTRLGDTVVEVCPMELVQDLNLASMSSVRRVSGTLYLYSEQEHKVLLQTKDTLKRYDVIGNPVCFAADGIARETVNDVFLDKPVVLYLTDYKKIPNLVIMITNERGV